MKYSFTWNGTSCRTKGIRLFSMPDIIRPEERVNHVVIPGRSGELTLVPVTDSADITFDDLVGYESQKKTLRDNTEAFVSGLYANNVLLYGDSGTGKSTSVHALMHEYSERGLRLIEVSKPDR